jgi:hypothetical protein
MIQKSLWETHKKQTKIGRFDVKTGFYRKKKNYEVLERTIQHEGLSLYSAFLSKERMDKITHSAEIEKWIVDKNYIWWIPSQFIPKYI